VHQNSLPESDYENFIINVVIIDYFLRKCGKRQATDSLENAWY
jgi:hypothetical protein